MTEIADLVERLRAVEETLRDLAYDRLREAAEHPDDDTTRSRATAAEKRLLQARRAIERAITALESVV